MAGWCGGLWVTVWGWGWRTVTSWRMGLRRRGGLRGRVSTLLLCLLLLLLLAVHILLPHLHLYPSPTSREKRTDYAPRQVSCHLYPPDTDSAVHNSTRSVTKVLLLTYMQAGGSFLLSQLFDKSENNISFWREPVDGILSDLYGTLHGWHPLDVFTHEAGLPRHVPVCEEKAIIHHLSALYTCHLASVPLEVLTTQNTRHFLPCIQEILADLSPSRSSSHPAVVCKELLLRHCPRGPYGAALMNCYRQIQSFKSVQLGVLRGLTDDDEEEIAEYDHQDVFQLYMKCMAALQYHSMKCLHLYTSTCKNSDTVVVKSTRLRGEQVAGLMHKHPDLKVIHLVRDPRGIAWSREKSHKLSQVSGWNFIKEAALLCQRMRHDLTHLERLKHRYPDEVISLQYEQFMQNPQKAVQDVYSLLQKPIPPKVQNWVNMKMEQLRETGPDGKVTPRNMSKHAFRWRKQIANSDNRHIVKKCADVLKSLKYSPLH